MPPSSSARSKGKVAHNSGGLICTASDKYYNRSATWRFAVPKGHQVALRSFQFTRRGASLMVRLMNLGLSRPCHYFRRWHSSSVLRRSHRFRHHSAS
jgi:hypothetical protein